ncbi:MAG: RNA-directed DNA polymerase [Clostridia bacterium]|nr:RNA-directed DNA polymerase [Clostridia bacterium]
MITYKELSSLTNDLGFSARALYSITHNIHKHYKPVSIPKGNGEMRKLCVPDKFLKAVQRSIARNLLSYEEISPYATAYRLCGSTVVNARPHLGAEVILKLDICHFFDHIIYPVVKDKVFPGEKYSEANRVLLTLLCTYRESIPQGAPTSPAISNIVMRDFDDTVGVWCEDRGICYTRYCDDMTFSGDFSPKEVISFVRTELGKKGYFLNNRKKVIAKRGQKMQVTGIMVNEKLNVPNTYRRKLRQELYYCRKFGIKSHMEKIGVEITEQEYIMKLLGRVNYLLQVTPDDKSAKEAKLWLIKELKKASL